MTDEELKKMADAYEEEQKILNRKRHQLQTIQTVKKFISSVRSGQDLRAQFDSGASWFSVYVAESPQAIQSFVQGHVPRR